VDGFLDSPVDVAPDLQGGLYVCDGNARRVIHFDERGRPRATLGDEHSAARLRRPVSVDCAGDGSIWVLDQYTRQVHCFGSDGTSLALFKLVSPGGPASLFVSLAVNQEGNLVVAEQRRGFLLTLSSSGQLLRTVNLRLALQRDVHPGRIATAEDGEVLVIDQTSACVMRVGFSGAVTCALDPAALPSEERASKPVGIAVDEAGHLCLSDRASDSVMVYSFS